YRFRAMTPRALPASSGRSSVGSRSFRNGAPAVKAASVSSNVGMDCADHSTKDRTASGAGSDSASSPTTSSISAHTWPSKHARGEIPHNQITTSLYSLTRLITRLRSPSAPTVNALLQTMLIRNHVAGRVGTVQGSFLNFKWESS